MAPRHRQPCAGAMLRHVDVNTEQAFTTTASYFTYHISTAVSYTSSVQAEPTAVITAVNHLNLPLVVH